MTTQAVKFSCTLTKIDALLCAADLIKNSSQIDAGYKIFNTPAYTGLRDKIAKHIDDEKLPLSLGENIPSAIENSVFIF